MVASKANRCDNLMVLLHSMKCPIDAQDAKFGRTALSWAAMSGKADAVQSLLRYSAHPGIRDANGMLPLHYACLHGHVQCAQLIVSTTKGLTGLQTAKKYAENPEICSIIHEAIYRRQKSIVNPTLFECAMNGDADRLYSTLEDGDNVNPLTGTGDWPMYMAVGNRHIKVMQLLYMNGGDIWSQHQTTGSTVLHIACSRGLYDIVSYLLRFSPVQTSSNSNCEDRQIDINAVNHLGLTALQVAAAKGFSRIVKLLLTHDASSALVNSQGQLYRCCEFEGVQVLIERSQRRRAEEIVKYIKSSSSLDQLIKVWQGKFDHNLRNRNGDTPLMVACLYGKTEAVEFLLRSAIQIVEEREQDIDLSLQSKGEQNDCFVDSGAFDGVSPGYPSSNNRSFVSVDKYCAEQDTWSSVTDLSDQDSEPHGHPEKQCRMFSSDLKGFSSSVNLQSRYLAKCNSYDAESLDSGDDTYKGPFHCPTSKKASLYRRNAFSSSDLNMQQSISDLREKNHASPRPASLDPSSCKIFQGTRVNHLCAVNMRDGCAAIHRAVECIDEQKGVTNLLLLIAKDCSVINLQNFQGLSPLHLAAKLERKQIVKTLTNLKSVDLNLRSSSGKLPEDMTRSKKIHHLIQDARQHWKEHRPLAQMEKLPMSPHGSVVGTSIDFDKLEKRFEQLRNSNNCDP
ncbi:ankyrin-3-like [Acanthaster planci]|uniref:Ankyrin-3-like n=1 Tax=Acanthaster planci TaxID=133434 RepID=A0A8B7ZVS2_ACAPL|nr:ankyrin-3-like [Acanthaster planci]